MQELLDRFAETIPDTDHVALFLDRAGWHGATALKVPDCITLVPLPAYSPELNPVERIWEYLKERYLSHRLLDDYDAIVEAASCAWRAHRRSRTTDIAYLAALGCGKQQRVRICDPEWIRVCNHRNLAVATDGASRLN